MFFSLTFPKSNFKLRSVFTLIIKQFTAFKYLWYKAFWISLWLPLYLSCLNFFIPLDLTCFMNLFFCWSEYMIKENKSSLWSDWRLWKLSVVLWNLFLKTCKDFGINLSKKLDSDKSSGNSNIYRAVKSAHTHSPSKLHKEWPCWGSNIIFWSDVKKRLSMILFSSSKILESKKL